MEKSKNESAETVMERRIRHKKAYIVRLMREQGLYSPELSQQVQLAAALLVRASYLESLMREPDYLPYVEEKSREGYPRYKAHPVEELYLKCMSQAQLALRALGLNADAKERKTDSDAFSEFMSKFSEDE